MRIAEFDTFPYMKCMERKGSRKKKKKSSNQNAWWARDVINYKLNDCT